MQGGRAAGSTATESILPAGSSSASGCIQSDARHQSAPTTVSGFVSGHGGTSSGVVSGIAQWHLVPKAVLDQIKVKMTALHCHDHECSECQSAHCTLLDVLQMHGPLCHASAAGWAVVHMHQHSMQNDACTFLGCTVWLCLQKSLHSWNIMVLVADGFATAWSICQCHELQVYAGPSCDHLGIQVCWPLQITV